MSMLSIRKTRISSDGWSFLFSFTIEINFSFYFVLCQHFQFLFIYRSLNDFSFTFTYCQGQSFLASLCPKFWNSCFHCLMT